MVVPKHRQTSPRQPPKPLGLHWKPPPEPTLDELLKPRHRAAERYYARYRRTPAQSTNKDPRIKSPSNDLNRRPMLGLSGFGSLAFSPRGGDNANFGSPTVLMGSPSAGRWDSLRNSINMKRPSEMGTGKSFFDTIMTLVDQQSVSRKSEKRVRVEDDKVDDAKAGDVSFENREEELDPMVPGNWAKISKKQSTTYRFHCGDVSPRVRQLNNAFDQLLRTKTEALAKRKKANATDVADVVYDRHLKEAADAVDEVTKAAHRVEYMLSGGYREAAMETFGAPTSGGRRGRHHETNAHTRAAAKAWRGGNERRVIDLDASLEVGARRRMSVQRLEEEHSVSPTRAAALQSNGRPSTAPALKRGPKPPSAIRYRGPAIDRVLAEEKRRLVEKHAVMERRSEEALERRQQHEQELYDRLEEMDRKRQERSARIQTPQALCGGYLQSRVEKLVKGVETKPKRGTSRQPSPPGKKPMIPKPPPKKQAATAAAAPAASTVVEGEASAASPPAVCATPPPEDSPIVAQVEPPSSNSDATPKE